MLNHREKGGSDRDPRTEEEGHQIGREELFVVDTIARQRRDPTEDNDAKKDVPTLLPGSGRELITVLWRFSGTSSLVPEWARCSARR
jgi:hypothetical protein